jgi:molybdenum cofactor cytidylyltransferase
VKDVEGIVLAAGLSRRSKRYKMTLPLGDRTVLERTIESMSPFVDRVIVVLGSRAERLRALLAGSAEVSLVYNERFREGMFSSVRAGMAHITASRFFLLPGDQPLVAPQVYERLLAADERVVIPTYRGRKGHPVLLRGKLVSDVLVMPAEATLWDVIERTGYTTIEVEDEGILLDLDTAADYATILSRYRAQHGYSEEQDG